MTGWLDQPLFALDTETTGTNPETARVVQSCIGRSGRIGEWTPKTRLINPGVPIPAEATAVHGITDDRVQTEGTLPVGPLTDMWMTLSWLAASRTPLVAPSTTPNAAGGRGNRTPPKPTRSATAHPSPASRTGHSSVPYDYYPHPAPPTPTEEIR